MKEISLSCEGGKYQTSSFTFPGGEIQVQIPGLPDRLRGDLTVLARLQSPESLIQLCLLTEILDRVHEGKRTLVIPYFPYARQDRVMNANEAFSLKAIIRVINSLRFDEVMVCDPHSDVTPALVENIRIIPQVELIASHPGVLGVLRENRPLLVAPDAGAAKKACAVAQRFGLHLLTASKSRDTATGAITRTEVQDPGGLEGGDGLIVDDICDGGRTFIELANVLRRKGVARVYLYVTHGIFSQGLDVFEGIIDGVYTTDSFETSKIGEAPCVPVSVLGISGVLACL